MEKSYFEDLIKKKTEEYCKLLEVPLNKVLIEYPIQEDSFAMQYFADEKTILYEIKPFYYLNHLEEDVNLVVLHECCHARDLFEGLYQLQKSIINPRSHELLSLSKASAGVREAYEEYLVSKRQITLQSKEDYIKWLSRDLKRFIKDIERMMKNNKDYVLALFSDLIKCKFIGYQPSYIPKVMFIFMGWLIEDFKYIESLNINWELRNEILNAEATFLYFIIGMAESYKKNKIVLHPSAKRNLEHDNFTSLLFKRFEKHIQEEGLKYSKELKKRFIERVKTLSTNPFN